MNTKERLLQYLDRKGVNKSQFFSNVGLSRTNFTGANLLKSLSSDALVKILTYCPDLSAEWLMRGEGDMLRPSSAQIARKHSAVAAGSKAKQSAGLSRSGKLAAAGASIVGGLIANSLTAGVSFSGLLPALPLRNKRLREEEADRQELAGIVGRLNELLERMERRGDD